MGVLRGRIVPSRGIARRRRTRRGGDGGQGRSLRDPRRRRARAHHQERHGVARARQRRGSVVPVDADCTGWRADMPTRPVARRSSMRRSTLRAPRPRPSRARPAAATPRSLLACAHLNGAASSARPVRGARGHRWTGARAFLNDSLPDCRVASTVRSIPRRPQRQRPRVPLHRATAPQIERP